MSRTGIGIGISPIFNYLAAGIPTFEFDAALSVFTARMAKRTAPGPFAAAPIMQGKWDSTGTPDNVLFGQGAQIHGSFYANFDPYQGSVILWFTPEWDGNDGQLHYLFNNVTANGLEVYKHTDDRIYIAVGGQSVSVDVSGWTAGTTYFLVFRWDTNNPLDGTNYLSISINDVHAFGGSSVPTIVAPAATLYIGHTGSAYAADGIIGGMAITRMVLFDGAYGVDLGQGDVINTVWAAGAGADWALAVGSWDVCFGLPTNSAVGEFATASTEAWAHPFNSAIMEETFLTDGFYGGGAYAVGFNGTNTKIVVSDNATIQDLQDDAFTVEMWANTSVFGESATFDRLIEKVQWSFLYHGSQGLRANIATDGTGAESRSGTDETLDNDGKWHHVVFFYDDAGDRKIYFAIDGIWVASYDVQTAATGSITTDVGDDLYIGETAGGSAAYDGLFGWVRISDNDRHSHGTDFVPPRLMPAADGNTVEQWHMNDGTGATVAATVAGANNGTLGNGTWVEQWDAEGTIVVPKSVAFDGADTSINCGSDASLDDLADNAFTVDGWVRADSYGEGNSGRIVSKTSTNIGWDFHLHNLNGLGAYVQCATTDADSKSGLDEITADGRWHHVTMYFNDAGDRKIYFAVDGIWVTSYTAQVAGVGAIGSDAALDLLIGDRDDSARTFDGTIAWLRISDNDRHGHGVDFTPPPRTVPPADDVNTVSLWRMEEGAGTTVVDANANCLLPDTRLFTGSGYKKAIDIVEGEVETIYQRDGQFGEIKKYWSRDHEGEIVRIKARGMQSIGITPEHLVLHIDGEEVKSRRASVGQRRYKEGNPSLEIDVSGLSPEWAPAEDIRVGDYVLVPQPKFETRKDIELKFSHGHIGFRKEEIFELFKQGLTPNKISGADYGVLDATIQRYYALYKTKDTKNYPAPSLTNKTVLLDKEWAEIFGWWVAEGCVAYVNDIPARVIFTLSQHELEEATRIKDLLEKKTGNSVCLMQQPTASRIDIGSVALAQFMVDHFGSGALNKRIPEWLLLAEIGIIKAFLLAYNTGDGCVHKRRAGYNPLLEMVTSSPSLVSGISLLLMKLGILPLITDGPNGGEREIGGRIFMTRPNWGVKVTGHDVNILYPEIHIVDNKQMYLKGDDFFYARVSAIGREGYLGKVYDFTTETSSLGLPFIVHNSNDGTITDGSWINAVDLAQDGSGEQIYGIGGYVVAGITNDIRDEDRFGLFDEAGGSILEE